MQVASNKTKIACGKAVFMPEIVEFTWGTFCNFQMFHAKTTIFLTNNTKNQCFPKTKGYHVYVH